MYKFKLLAITAIAIIGALLIYNHFDNIRQEEPVVDKFINEYGVNVPPAEFGKVAQEISECSSKKKGGELGYFTRGQMVKEFEDAAFSTQPGQITNIIKTVHGYHIILVEERKASIK